MNEPGRSCPLRYRYRPDVFAGSVALRAETLYVVGGVYGNVESLRESLAMREREQQHSGAKVELLFNGDFNWFDCDAEGFAEINETVLRHAALQGNVEAELSVDGDDNGCGCNYPEHVESVVVERSNAIMQRLRARAMHFPGVQRRVAALPMNCTVGVGDATIGVLHGDPESLAGWGLAVDAMPEPCRSSTTIENWFDQAGVDVFASTHTGLPFMQDFEAGGRRRIVANNGAAGLPNFAGERFGLLTRISARPEIPPDSVYGTTLGAVRIDAIRIRYDAAAWFERFLANWPAGSPGHDAYFSRISQGPQFTVRQAVRLADRSTNAAARPLH